MAVSPKERILTRVRNALIQKTERPFTDPEGTGGIYKPLTEELSVAFAQAFQAVQGNFIYCESPDECADALAALADQNAWEHLYCWDDTLQSLFAERDFRKVRIGHKLDKADAGIMRCEALIARTGSILLSSRLASGRTLSIYPPIQIVVASTRQLVADIGDGLTMLRRKYQGALPSMINLATGPSRTADIEKTLVLGAHGPRAVYVFLIEDWD
jgi:L-lactate dehydrogenase complex protein LldG